MSAFEESSPERCPSENEVVTLFCGKLAPDALGRLLAHAERCSACALVVAEAGLAFAQPEGHHAPSRSPRSVFAPGQVVASRYLIERRIGRGGMGEVYSALDQEFGDRVALKTICPGFASDPSSVDRFKLELRLARSISHPSVCRVFEFGRHELSPGASQCFFTLQFIEGVTLRQELLDAGPLDLVAAVRLTQDLAWGLEAIHLQNVVHRDIKPENVMLPSKQGAAAAIWVDFGLARVDLRESRSAGVLAGTPDYSAPELVRGDVASRGSDLYAFGVMMYELLTGALPFARRTSFWAATERPAVELRGPRALRSEIPPELDALVLACLQESAELRPPSAAHVATRLRAIATLIDPNLEPHSRSSHSQGSHSRESRDLVRSPLADSGPVRSTSNAATRWRLIVSLAITAAGTGLAIYHTAIPEDSPLPATLATQAAPAPSLPPAPPAANTASTAAEIALPERKAAPKRVAAPPSTAPSSAATRSAPPGLRTLPDFGGRR